MNNNTKLFLSLIRDYIQQVSSEDTIRTHIEETDAKIEWELIFKLAAYNNALPFVYNQVNKLADEFRIEQRFMISIKNMIIRRSSNQIIADDYLTKIIDALNNANIQFIILKGVILSKLYPNPEYRYSSDADIHIDSNYFDAVHKIMTDMGYQHKYANTVSYDYSYLLNGVHIEIHTRLFEDFYDKHSKVLEEYGLDSLVHTMNYNILGKDIVSLQPNEFLIHNICHLTKHFVDSGINLRHLMDITIYVNSYIDQLDINHVMTFFMKMKIAEFVEYTFYICNKYLGMTDIPEISYTHINENVLAEFLSDFLEHTAEGHTDISKTSAFLAYYKDDKSIIKERIIPNQSILSDRYKYAKKHKLLLPIAWVHRWFDHIMRIMKTSIHLKSFKSSSRRIDLLRKLGLLK